MPPIAPKVARILIPTDYSDTADHALAWAILHAKTFAAEVTALHVRSSHAHFGALGLADERADTALADDRARLDACVAERFAGSGVTVHALLEVGDPALKIREVARRDQIDLIIMGTHGTSRLEDLLFGSVTEKVVHHTGCPVLVVPPRTAAA
jgi:nucleotide-binding universal stress UspA family protein